jgi:Domain of unknown function (DUF4177)
MNEQELEYTFVRLEFSSILGSPKNAEAEYQNVIQDHAEKGWRLVQIFAPGNLGFGIVPYYEIVLERRIQHNKPL